MYSMLRRALFSLDPETSHELSLDMLAALERIKLIGMLKAKVPSGPKQVMGLTFPNPLGLAAGLDKNGECFNALGALGFGSVEIGTVTPLAQSGNPRPRLFRLKEHEAIINRMGFNNEGVEAMVPRLKQRRYTGVLGINIGKNKVTPEEDALSDYVSCMQAVYRYADYLTVNISSPNTPGLRNLQHGDVLAGLLAGIRDERARLSDIHARRVPIAVKIAPDNDFDAIKQMAETLVEHDMDAVVATNTTLDRSLVKGHRHADETGGLSGAPLRDKANEVVACLRQELQGALPIIGVGGIRSATDAVERMQAGADLLQVYSGFIYHGPALIEDVWRGLNSYDLW